MTTRLELATPWAQQSLAPAARARVRAAVPDGHTLVVTARREPGDWTLRLVRGDELRWLMRVMDRDLERACLFALERHA